MFERLSRSWTLVKASAAVLQQDRKLLLFPLISALAMFAVLLSFALPALGAMALGGGMHTGGPDGNNALYVMAFFFYLTQYFVIFFFNAALVSAAMARMNGSNPSLQDSLRVAASKWLSILGYAAIAATVGMVLRAIQERVGFVGRIVTGLLGAGWTIATYLVVPVLVARDVGPIDAVKESAQILKRTWGENLAGQAGMGAAFGLLQFLLIVLGIGLVVLAATAGSSLLVVLSVLLVISAVLLSVLVHGSLSGIYAAALYRYATGSSNGNSQNTQGFDSAAMRLAFVAKN
jgi:hypothetical protein